VRLIPLLVVALVASAGLTTIALAPSGFDVAVSARALAPGELAVLTITAPVDVHDVRITAFGRVVPVAAAATREWRALIGIDLDVMPGTHAIAITGRSGDTPLETTYSMVIKAHRFPTRRLEVDAAFVNPPAAVEERLIREAADLERLWKESSADQLWLGRFVAPVANQATSSFGTRSIFNGEPRSPHSGADFRSPAGTPIKAPNAGRVVLAKDLYFSGNTIVIDHGMGIMSLFAHLSEFAVHEGEIVSTGTIIGKVGATGRVTGPHLHWAVRVNGARVDPLALLAVLH
jgi:murein DD-endopeptidase MepM/ murein hydrolase activator NlpD